VTNKLLFASCHIEVGRKLSEPRPGLKVEVGRIGPGPYETLVDLTEAPVFPFFRIILEKTNKAQSADLQLLVSPTIYNYLSDRLHTEKIVFYLNTRTGRMEAWTWDMLESIRILTNLRAMSREDQWILKARSYIGHVFAGTEGEKAQIPYEGEGGLEFVKSVLRASGILDKVDSDPKLLGIARDITDSGKKDFESCVYRLAMALYHSRRYSGQSVVPEIDDPGASYLALVGNVECQEKYPSLKESIRRWPDQRRTDMMKTFICFCIASYLCQKAARESSR